MPANFALGRNCLCYFLWKKFMDSLGAHHFYLSLGDHPPTKGCLDAYISEDEMSLDSVSDQFGYQVRWQELSSILDNCTTLEELAHAMDNFAKGCEELFNPDAELERRLSRRIEEMIIVAYPSPSGGEDSCKLIISSLKKISLEDFELVRVLEALITFMSICGKLSIEITTLLISILQNARLTPAIQYLLNKLRPHLESVIRARIKCGGNFSATPDQICMLVSHLPNLAWNEAEEKLVFIAGLEKNCRTQFSQQQIDTIKKELRNLRKTQLHEIMNLLYTVRKIPDDTKKLVVLTYLEFYLNYCDQLTIDHSSNSHSAVDVAKAVLCLSDLLQKKAPQAVDVIRLLAIRTDCHVATDMQNGLVEIHYDSGDIEEGTMNLLRNSACEKDWRVDCNDGQIRLIRQQEPQFKGILRKPKSEAFSLQDIRMENGQSRKRPLTEGPDERTSLKRVRWDPNLEKIVAPPIRQNHLPHQVRFDNENWGDRRRGPLAPRDPR
jgi:hypothetical protein